MTRSLKEKWLKIVNSEKYILYDMHLPLYFGAPVIGKGDVGFCVKAIHVQAMDGLEVGGGQNISNVLDDIEMGVQKEIQELPNKRQKN